MTSALLQTQDLVVEFAQGRFLGRRVVHALNSVSIQLHSGETLGIVGETGCGKSTLLRTLMRLYRPRSGQILFDGKDVSRASERQLKTLRQQMQMVFQDPADSMNPRLTVGSIVGEPLLLHRRWKEEVRLAEVRRLLAGVGMADDIADRYPHEFSGGQRQRIAIARALALQPRILLCDEPVSALDVSVQSQVLNLLMDLQKHQGLSLIIVSHDLSVVRHMSDRVVVMYLGTVVEQAPSQRIYQEPKHPYTKVLIDAIPDTRQVGVRPSSTFRGEPPSALTLPSGCPFRLACPLAAARCSVERPLLREVSPGHSVACHFA